MCLLSQTPLLQQNHRVLPRPFSTGFSLLNQTPARDTTKPHQATGCSPSDTTKCRHHHLNHATLSRAAPTIFSMLRTRLRTCSPKPTTRTMWPFHFALSTCDMWWTEQKILHNIHQKRLKEHEQPPKKLQRSCSIIQYPSSTSPSRDTKSLPRHPQCCNPAGHHEGSAGPYLKPRGHRPRALLPDESWDLPVLGKSAKHSTQPLRHELLQQRCGYVRGSCSLQCCHSNATLSAQSALKIIKDH